MDYPMVVYLIDLMDNFVTIFFSVEFITRVIVCPRKIKFIKKTMNIVDLLAVAPFYISILLGRSLALSYTKSKLTKNLEGLEDFEVIGKTGKIIRLVRIMRVLRIFKLVRHFAGLQSLIITLQQAYKELGLLLVLIVVAILVYSSLVYFAERDSIDLVANNCTDWKNREDALVTI